MAPVSDFRTSPCLDSYPYKGLEHLFVVETNMDGPAQSPIKSFQARLGLAAGFIRSGRLGEPLPETGDRKRRTPSEAITFDQDAAPWFSSSKLVSFNCPRPSIMRTLERLCYDYEAGSCSCGSGEAENYDFFVGSDLFKHFLSLLRAAAGERGFSGVEGENNFWSVAGWVA